MAFGQQAGPPATGKQVQELLGLLHEAGHVDFRDARGPMGFTQRQAGGKFTRDEAEAFIEQLQAEADSSVAAEAGAESGSGGGPAAPATPAPRLSSSEQALRRIPTERLAAELQRRGWVVLEP